MCIGTGNRVRRGTRSQHESHEWLRVISSRGKTKFSFYRYFSRAYSWSTRETSKLPGRTRRSGHPFQRRTYTSARACRRIGAGSRTPSSLFGTKTERRRRITYRVSRSLAAAGVRTLVPITLRVPSYVYRPCRFNFTRTTRRPNRFYRNSTADRSRSTSESFPKRARNRIKKKKKNNKIALIAHRRERAIRSGHANGGFLTALFTLRRERPPTPPIFHVRVPRGRAFTFKKAFSLPDVPYNTERTTSTDDVRDNCGCFLVRVKLTP